MAVTTSAECVSQIEACQHRGFDAGWKLRLGDIADSWPWPPEGELLSGNDWAGSGCLRRRIAVQCSLGLSAAWPSGMTASFFGIANAGAVCAESIATRFRLRLGCALFARILEERRPDRDRQKPPKVSNLRRPETGGQSRLQHLSHILVKLGALAPCGAAALAVERDVLRRWGGSGFEP